jgi:hypothetical protein
MGTVTIQSKKTGRVQTVHADSYLHRDAKKPNSAFFIVEENPDAIVIPQKLEVAKDDSKKKVTKEKEVAQPAEKVEDEQPTAEGQPSEAQESQEEKTAKKKGGRPPKAK